MDAKAEVINPFSAAGVAAKYHKYRPRCHHIPLGMIREFVGKNFAAALDVACGTGHSTEALSQIAQKVIGCDMSEPMLVEARKRFPLEFVKAAAEHLPFADATFDFLNISMGFHWVDHAAFLQEARRVLRNDRYLAIDSYGFSGTISPDVQKQKLHHEFFTKHLPSASKRSRYPGQELLNQTRLTLVKEIAYNHKIQMTADEFTNLVMTWSNFQILAEDQKGIVSGKMQTLYTAIFAGGKLELEFGGKTLLYKFLP